MIIEILMENKRQKLSKSNNLKLIIDGGDLYEAIGGSFWGGGAWPRASHPLPDRERV
jgi:hypothetical protein